MAPGDNIPYANPGQAFTGQSMAPGAFPAQNMPPGSFMAPGAFPAQNMPPGSFKPPGSVSFTPQAGAPPQFGPPGGPGYAAFPGGPLPHEMAAFPGMFPTAQQPGYNQMQPMQPNAPGYYAASGFGAPEPGGMARMPTSVFVQEQKKKAADGWKCEGLQAGFVAYVIWLCYGQWCEFSLMTCTVHDANTWYLCEILALCIFFLLKCWSCQSERWWGNNEEYHASVLHDDVDHDPEAHAEKIRFETDRNHSRGLRATLMLVLLLFFVVWGLVGAAWARDLHGGIDCNPDLILMLQTNSTFNFIVPCCLSCHYCSQARTS